MDIRLCGKVGYGMINLRFIFFWEFMGFKNEWGIVLIIGKC